MAEKKDTSDVTEAEPLTWKFLKKRRYIVTLMVFIGFFNLYTTRVNLSVAIVAMTENTTVIGRDGSRRYEQDFDWDTKQRGILLSSFFYGYITTQFLGGFVGAKIGGTIVFGAGVGISAILTLFTELAARHSLEMLLALRVLLGIFQGVVIPSVHAIWSRWAPPLERSRMASIAFAGNWMGTVAAMPGSGLLATYYGWPSVFYAFGGVACVWFIFWLGFIRAGPERDRFCSEDEANFIAKRIGVNTKMGFKHPWKSIFTSRVVYAIICAHFTSNWGFYTLLTQLPSYLRDTLNYDLGNTGLLAAIPYIVMSICNAFSGYLADWVQVKGYLSTTTTRKCFNNVSFLLQAIFIVLTGFMTKPIWVMSCVTVAVGAGAFSWSGFGVNHLDIAPQHASVIMGIGNTFATVPGIVSPMLTGWIVQDHSREQWQIVFFICGGMYITGATVYQFCASGELQEWAQAREGGGYDKPNLESME